MLILNMKVRNQEQITKLTSLMWKKYNRKGIRPPLAMIRKLAMLQGKTKEEASQMKYREFKNGTKMPWDCNNDEYAEFWEADTEEEWIPPRDSAMSITKPPQGYGWVKGSDGKYPHCHFKPNLLGITNSSSKLTLETSIEDILSNKIPLMELSPYSWRKSNRGFVVLKKWRHLF